jgi:EpsD family peptidyl-prolyl cis-trans isomerase
VKTQVTQPVAPTGLRASSRALQIALVAMAASGTLLVAGCGPKKSAESTQVAAKVNGDEITVSQVDGLLQQQHMPPGSPQAQAMRKQALDRLIDQQIAVQRAEKAKLDRDPKVMLAIEAARRDVLTRAYVESIADQVAKPSAAEVKAYYDSKPAQYADRKIYVLQKVDANVPPEQRAAAVEKLQATKSATEVTDWLTAQKIKFNTSTTNQPSESLGANLDKIAALKDGQSIALAQSYGVTVVTLQSTQPAPVELEKARPQIEQQMLNERKREAVMKQVKDIRVDAKIEYEGAFAASAPMAMPMPPMPAPAPAAVPASSVAPAASGATAASAAMDPATLKKGLGIK